MLKFLLATAALATLALAAPAHATLQVCVLEDGGTPTCSATSATGAITFAPTLTNFANISVSSTGVPIETNPDLATTDLSADTVSGFTGTHTLEIEVFQTGLTPVSANLQSTFTVNGLIGTTAFPGPSTLSDYTGGTGTTLGTLLHSMTFGAIASGTNQFGPTTIPGITSDAQEFLVTFSQAGQTVTDTIQTVGVPLAVPEPMSIALLGIGLLGIGFLVSARRFV